jgi:flavin reductase (NADH)
MYARLWQPALPAMIGIDAGDEHSVLYRTFMSAFPTGVTVVTTRDQQDRPLGITCTSLCSVTLNPPTLLVSIKSTSPTLSAMRSCGNFAVNLLHARGRSAAEIFSASAPDRFARLRWRSSPSLGLPWLTCDAFALAECYLKDTVVAGDHDIIFGEVISVTHSSDVPLIYGMRQFSAWPSQVLDAGRGLPDTLPEGGVSLAVPRGC